MAVNPFIVIKFGGTSVANLSCWQNISSITTDHLNHQRRPLLVCSAPSKVSNLLEAALEAALQNEHEAVIEEIADIYKQLARDLKLNFDTHLASYFHELMQRLTGISLLNEASPRVKATVMAFGEIMLTKLATAYLNQSGISATWLDARKCLISNTPPTLHTARAHLSTDCDFEYDESLVNTLQQQDGDVLVTQGFIASNSDGETVLLGRGGSDVSAAYFAAKLNAMRCEIWTDVPGIYSANPHIISQAKRLKALSYAEAQEIASMGAKVLHPRCIVPVKKANIPLCVKYTKDPNRPGTEISNEAQGVGQIKSVLTKTNVIAISIEGMDMWQQSGFLATIFQCFKKHNLSVDLVSTSEASVTLTLDTQANLLDSHALEMVLTDLNTFASAQTIGPCAVIGLVGHQIRTNLHKLGLLFSAFESQRIYMLSQAANDLNFAFVVDEDQVIRIAKKIHHLLVEQSGDALFFGPSWQQEFGDTPSEAPAWWQAQRDTLLEKAQSNSPLYVYDKATLTQNANALLQCDNIDRVFYAMKANNHEGILHCFYDLGLGFECVSIYEVEKILQHFPSIDRKRILFTPNFASKEEYQRGFELGIHMTVDNLFPLQHWGDVFHGQDILVRIDPGYGHGHHKFVKTGGKDSKFGIPAQDAQTVKKWADQHGARIIGLHAHSGSGILQAENWSELADFLTQHVLPHFPDATIMDLGGGFGIVEKVGQRALNLEEVNRALTHIKSNFPNLSLWVEPGRFLVAHAGVLLAKVTQLKQKAETTYIGLETGMNSLIRPALYGSYHPIVNLTRFNDDKNTLATIVGPICESGDTLGYARLMPETQTGDVFLIANAGAYGRVMSSHYNLREPALEMTI